RNAAERIEAAFGSGAVQATPKLKLEGYAFALNGKRELMTPDPDGPAAKKFKKRIEQYDPLQAYSAGMRALYEGSDKASTELTTFYTERSFDYERKNFKPTTAKEEDYEYGVELIQSLQLTPNNTLRFGGLYNHWVAPNGKRFYFGSRQDRQTLAAIVADELTLDRLILDGALRYARTYNNEYGGTSFNITGQRLNLEPVKDEWDDPVTVATLGAKYMLQEQSALYFHIAGGQHQPRAGALTADGSEPDNEKRVMVDAGISGENNIGKIKIGGFAARRDDVSVLTANSTTNAAGEEFFFSANENIHQYGLEIETQSQPVGDILSLVFNPTVMTSRKEEANGDWSDYKEIPNVILGGGIYSWLGRWDVNLFGKYVSEYENKRFAADKKYQDLGNYLDLSATVGYTLGAASNTRLYVSAENLLDDEYSTVVGWSDDGAKFYAGVQHQF
ncbi:MAG: TonB-dependent receptor, partial [Candidatus Hydrogenedentota bacterium]